MVALAVTTLFLALGLALPAVAMSSTLYVSPSGSDTHCLGTNKSCPLATVSKALEEANSMRYAVGAAELITVELSEGTFVTDEALKFSGGMCTGPVLVTGAGSGSSVISGSVPVTLQRSSSSTQRGAYYTATLDQSTFAQGHVWRAWKADGSGAVELASTPMWHYVRASEHGKDPSYIVVNDNQAAFFDAHRAQSLDNLVIYIYASWTSSFFKVKAWNSTTRTVMLNQPMPPFPSASGNRFRVVFGTPAALADVVGAPMPQQAITFDRETRELVYFPNESEQHAAPANITLLVPRLSTLFNISNCSGLTVEKVGIAHTDSFLDEQCLDHNKPCSFNYGADLTVSTVEVAHSDGVAFSNVSISGTGTYALRVRGTTSGTSLSSSVLRDLGCGGVWLGEGIVGIAPADLLLGGALITNNVITDGGHVVEMGSGVFMQAGAGLRVTHNNISDFYNTGIATGWGWDFRETSTRNNYYGFNLIHSIGRGRLSDMGCIHTLAQQFNSVVDNNVCFDVQTYGYGGNGLYADQGTSDMVWSNNIVHTVKQSGFLSHFNLNVTMVNNVFAHPEQITVNDDTRTPGMQGVSAATAPHPSARTLDHFVFHSNIVFLTNASAWFARGPHPTSLRNSTFAGNCYWNTAVPPTDLTFFTGTSNESWAEWQALGNDHHGAVADPQFARWPTGDELAPYSAIAAGSECLAVGFRPISTDRVGARHD